MGPLPAHINCFRRYWITSCAPLYHRLDLIRANTCVAVMGPVLFSSSFRLTGASISREMRDEGKGHKAMQYATWRNLFRCRIDQMPLCISFDTIGCPPSIARHVPLLHVGGPCAAGRWRQIAAGSALRDAAPDIHLSGDGRPFNRCTVGPWKPHLAFGDPLGNKSPAIPAATWAENCIGSIWSSTQSTGPRKKLES